MSDNTAGISEADPRGTDSSRGDDQAGRNAVEVRNRRLAHAGVARAEDLLLSRYPLASRQAAFELLRDTSQRFNIKLHTLAHIAVRVPAPASAPDRDRGRPEGALRRVRPGPPPLPGLALDPGASPTSDGAILKAALRRVLDVTDTDMGNVQLAQNGLLRLEAHTGLNRYFTDYFAFVESSTTACSQAAEENRQITVKDVEASDIFDEGSREAILQAGSRSCHSMPLTSPRGAVIGMISSHHEHPLTEFTTAQLTAMEHLGSQVGRWLVWHRNTVVLNALDHLHATAERRGPLRG